MFAANLLVVCLLAVDALGKLQSQSERKDRTNNEARPVSRLLLALRNLRNIRRDGQAALLSRAQVVASSRPNTVARRSGLFATAPNVVGKYPPVRWIGVDESRTPSKSQKTRTMPLFPLASYVPYTTQVLNIFEPRYRKMYDDILFSGARRFAVCHMNRDGELLETATVFYLEDLRMVSEETNDRVKYIGEHSVIGRVKLLKVLNPEVAETREMYLKVEVEDIVDTDSDVDTSAKELELRNLFRDFVILQHRVEETVRFSVDLTRTLTFNRSAETVGVNVGLWGVIALWEQFLEARVSQAQTEARANMRNALQELKDMDASSADVDELVKDNQNVLADRIRNIIVDSKEQLRISDSLPTGDGMLSLIQSNSHSERLDIFRQLLEQQFKRLEAIESLKSMFD